MLQPVIMAGGLGTRLWPLSRELYPKQFLNLCGDRSLLQKTVSRIEAMNALNPIVVCNEEHRFLVAEQLRAIDRHHGSIVLEPVGRNTAPAIALAAWEAMTQNDDPVLFIMPSDHIISNERAFQTALKRAYELAQVGKLVTFGIPPSHPETGYGYIKRGSVLSDDAFEVLQFTEKPTLKKAEEFLNASCYFWNSGMFMFHASVYLKELERFCPKLFACCKQSFAKRQQDNDFIRIDETSFKACPNESVDYAVMEKTSSAVVVALDVGWSDIGSWHAVWEAHEKDTSGNVDVGDVLHVNTKNSFVHAQSRMVTTIGLDNVIIIETPDAILVANKNKVQLVKDVVAQLKDDNRQEVKNHRQVYRPWGMYDSIDYGQRHQVKRIVVDPGKKLSVQMHFHRAEHWVVVSGTAKVTNGDKTYLISENESTFIPIGQIHALENPGKVPLELIEVQSGSYLGEDDIVRFEDRYGRADKPSQTSNFTTQKPEEKEFVESGE